MGHRGSTFNSDIKTINDDMDLNRNVCVCVCVTVTYIQQTPNFGREVGGQEVGGSSALVEKSCKIYSF